MAQPIEKYSVKELMRYRQIAVNAIAGAKAKINSPGGWIAREANWKTIRLAENDIKIIDAELNLR